MTYVYFASFSLQQPRSRQPVTERVAAGWLEVLGQVHNSERSFQKVHNSVLRTLLEIGVLRGGAVWRGGVVWRRSRGGGPRITPQLRRDVEPRGRPSTLEIGPPARVFGR